MSTLCTTECEYLGRERRGVSGAAHVRFFATLPLSPHARGTEGARGEGHQKAGEHNKRRVVSCPLVLRLWCP